MTLQTVSFFACLALASTFAAAASSRVTYTDRYGVLSDRNIFLRDRSHPATRPSSTQPSRTEPEHALALTGIVFEDNAYRAYVENLASGTVTRVSVGDSIARGKVAEIQMDGINYDNPAGQRTWIAIGFDLAGQPVETSDALSLSPASTMPSGVEGLNPNDPTLTIEQKLKLRRMQELKGK